MELLSKKMIDLSQNSFFVIYYYVCNSIQKTYIQVGGKGMINSNMFDFFQLISTFLIGYGLFIIALAALRISKTYNSSVNFKKVEFTQEIINSKKDTIWGLKMWSEMINKNSYFEYVDDSVKVSYIDMYDRNKQVSDIYQILNYFSSLADGINKNIYDDNVVRINHENDMRIIIKNLRLFMRKNNLSLDIEDNMLKIEFLLRRWEERKNQGVLLSLLRRL
jgi:hypothetical protein